MAGLCAGNCAIDALQLRIDIAGDTEDVGPAVVVEVHDARAPADEAALAVDAGGGGHIVKLAFAVVAVEAGGLVADSGS